MTNKEKIEVGQGWDKDYRRLEPGEVFQEGDRINDEDDIGTSFSVYRSIGRPLERFEYGWRLNTDLTPGTIIEWGGDEGFIIPNVFNYDNAIMIAWVDGPICGKWTCHAMENIRYAVDKGMFTIKDEFSDRR